MISLKKILFSISFLYFIICFSKSINGQIIRADDNISSKVKSVSTDSLKSYISSLLTFQTRHNLSSKLDEKRGIGAATNFIFKKLNSFPKNITVERQVDILKYIAGGKDTRLKRVVELANILVTFKGSDPMDTRVILLLAHLDNRIDNNYDSTSFAPGANDNGSGVAALLEMSRILSNTSLPMTVKIAFLSGEEHGLVGSESLSDLALREKWNIMAVINNDMIGNTLASGSYLSNNTIVRVFSENIQYNEDDKKKLSRIFNSSENDSPSRQLARYIKEIGERYIDNTQIKLIYRNDRFGRGGDHTPFAKKGYTSTRISEYYENYDRTHQAVKVVDNKFFGDVIDGVDFEYLKKCCGINLAVVLNLSQSPAIPINVTINTSELSNYSEVSWENGAIGKKADGFYVLIRETDQSQWQKKILVKGTKIRLPISKDNYFFGCQAVDELGHETLPIFAVGKI